MGAHLDGRVDERGGAQQVVGNGLRGVVFHQGHVLVCRGVEDDHGPFLVQQPPRAIAVGHVVQQGAAGHARVVPSQAAVDLEEGVLGPFHQDHRAWRVFGA